MRMRALGIVLIIFSLGVDIWLATRLASGGSSSGVAIGFVIVSLPFLAAGIYFLMTAKVEIKDESKADKERTILNAVMTRGKVTIPDLAIEGNLTRDQVKAYIYDIIGKDLFRGYVNWDRGELVSAEAAQIKDGTCPNCGGKLELAGKGLVRCPFCGTETYLSAAGSAGANSPAPSAAAPGAALGGAASSGTPPPSGDPTQGTGIGGTAAGGAPAGTDLSVGSAPGSGGTTT